MKSFSEFQEEMNKKVPPVTGLGGGGGGTVNPLTNLCPMGDTTKLITVNAPAIVHIFFSIVRSLW